ncbi:MAG: hydrogenase maturation protease [Chloroflexota bacterium]
MRTLIFGLGNPILRDDAVGLVVARGVYTRVGGPGTEVDLVEASIAGLEILDIMAGYDKAVVVDAIQTAQGSPGALYRLSPDDLHTTPRLSSPHDVDFALALELGRQFGQHLPETVVVYAIEVLDPCTFGEELTPEVAARVPEIVQAIVAAEFGRQPCLSPDRGIVA